MRRTSGLALTASLLMAATGLAVVPAHAVPVGHPVTVVAQRPLSDDAFSYRAIQWSEGRIHAVVKEHRQRSMLHRERIEAFADEGSTPTDAPLSAVEIPSANGYSQRSNWAGSVLEGFSQTVFLIEPSSGSYTLRAPFYNYGYERLPGAGWGLGHLTADGAVAPTVVPPSAAVLDPTVGWADVGRSMAREPDGSVLLGGGYYDPRPGSSDVVMWGIAKLPGATTSADQQDETVPVAMGTNARIGGRVFDAPFLASDQVQANGEAVFGETYGLASTDDAIFVQSSSFLHRIDRSSGRIVTVVGATNGAALADGAAGTSVSARFGAVQPVVDAAGNVFFAATSTSDASGEPAAIWKLSAASGTLERVAGGGVQDLSTNGSDPLTLDLRPQGLALDESGNLYVSSLGVKDTNRAEILRVSGVATAIESAPVAVASTKIVGKPMIGGSLEVDGAEWSVAHGASTFQWNRDGQPVDGATDGRYRLSGGDRGRAITVTETYRVVGHRVAESVSEAVIPSTLTTVAKPVISGLQDSKKATVGLRVVTTPAASTPSAISYQWLRNGQPVPGATTSQYRFVLADRARELSVRVTARPMAAGFTTATATSSAHRRLGLVRPVSLRWSSVRSRTVVAGAGATTYLSGYRQTHTWWIHQPRVGRQATRNVEITACRNRLSCAMPTSARGKKTWVISRATRTGWPTATPSKSRVFRSR